MKLLPLDALVYTECCADCGPGGGTHQWNHRCHCASNDGSSGDILNQLRFQCGLGELAKLCGGDARDIASPGCGNLCIFKIDFSIAVQITD